MTKILTYDRGTIVADLARALAGSAITGGILLLLNPVPWIAVILWGCFALFTVFFLQTMRKAATTVSADAEQVQQVLALGPVKLGSSITWADITDIRLRYYSTKRKSPDGWMQLTLKGGGSKLTLDSSLDGFDLIAKQAGAIIKEFDLDPDPTTRENFLTFGVRLYDTE